MRTLLGVGAIALGLVGVLLCAVAIVLGWRVAVKTVDRVNHVATRLEQGLSAVDARLVRVESRLSAVRSDFDDVREKAAAIAEENPELPRVKAEIERLIGRLIPAFERVEATADSLHSVAESFRTASDVVDFVAHDLDATSRFRSVADTLDRSAGELDGIRKRLDELKSAKAVRLTRGLVLVARETAAGSERLAEGITSARQGIAVARGRTAEWRAEVVFWVYIAAVVNTFLWLWGGLGQLCQIGWGRRRMINSGPT